MEVVLASGGAARATNAFTVRAAPPVAVEAPAQVPETTTSAPPATTSPAPSTGGIPQGNGGDEDRDNNGGPSATGTSSAERLDQPTQDSLQPACRGCLPGGAGVVPGFQVREWVDREAAGCLPTSDPHLEMQVGSGRVARLSRLA